MTKQQEQKLEEIRREFAPVFEEIAARYENVAGEIRNEFARVMEEVYSPGLRDELDELNRKIAEREARYAFERWVSVTPAGWAKDRLDKTMRKLEAVDR